jgi:hypothetical protein
MIAITSAWVQLVFAGGTVAGGLAVVVGAGAVVGGTVTGGVVVGGVELGVDALAGRQMVRPANSTVREFDLLTL